MIKIRNRAGEIVTYTGLTEEKTAELAATIKRCLASQPTVLMAIVGNKGVGKSLLGKYFRNRGIGPFHRRKIAVIDDDNMAVDTLYFFRRWCPIPCTGVDELAPFMKYCRKKQIRIYITWISLFEKRILVISEKAMLPASIAECYELSNR